MQCAAYAALDAPLARAEVTVFIDELGRHLLGVAFRLLIDRNLTITIASRPCNTI